MSETQSTTPPAPQPDPGAGARDWLPEAYRADPAFQDFKDVAGLSASYSSAAKMVGMDKARVLALPTKEDDPGWGDVYTKLGRPEKADGYGITAEGADAPLWAKAQEAFHEAGLTKRQAEKMHGLVQQMQTGLEEGYGKEPVQAAEGFLGRIAGVVSSEAYATMVVAGLKQEWGQAFDDRMHAANRMVAEFGQSDPDIAKLFTAKDKGGYGLANLPGFIKLLATMGGKMAEPGGLTGGAGRNQTQRMSPTEGAAALARMGEDREFGKRLMASDPAAVEAWNAAQTALNG